MDQVCRPIEIILSDHSSTDGTTDVLNRLAAAYDGPHKITRLDCPLTEHNGMVGLNIHLKWAIEQTDCERILPMSGDDFALPDFAMTILRCFDEHPEAVMCATAMTFIQPEAIEECDYSSVSAHNRQGWITVSEVINNAVGGSCANAFTREFWNQVGPIPGACGPDLYMPGLAAAVGGFWYEYAPLYAHVMHKSVDNMGLGGVLRAVEEDDTARTQTLEHMQFQIGSAWLAVLRKLVSLGLGSPEDVNELANAALNTFGAWSDVRLDMTMRRIPPKGFPI